MSSIDTEEYNKSLSTHLYALTILNILQSQ